MRVLRVGIVLFVLLIPLRLGAQGARAEWPTYGGDYSAWRHSELAQITVDNVDRLTPVWAFQTGDYEQGLQATPIVVDGVLYLSTGKNRIFALDAATGALKWQFEYRGGPASIPSYPAQNRGVAVGHGLVFIGTYDNRVVAVDQETGREVWRVMVQDPARCGCNISAAPLVVKDLVVVGGTGGDFAHRGSLTAFDAKTGHFAWRFYVTPAPGEPGNETWKGDSWKYGGGAPWMTGSYDPDQDLIIWGTGNAAPDLDGSVREGDNLYTASVIALDPNDGKLRWYFQEVPHDVWDFDSAYECILVDLAIDGVMRKLVLHPNKTGYVWVIDRTTGEFVGAWPMVDEINWVAGITEDGKLVGRNEPVQGQSTRICPSVAGAKNWNQASYSPDTGLLYVPTLNYCNDLYVRPGDPDEGKPYIGGYWKPMLAEGRRHASGIAAFDPVNGEKAWEYEYRYPLLASVLTTAGGLVFSGDAVGDFFALDAKTGEKLWRFATGSGHRGSSISYEVDGRQYIATPSGWGSLAGAMRALHPELADLPLTGATLFVFALPEGAAE